MSDLTNALRGELLKLWKRPAFRVLALIAVVLVLVPYYIAGYINYRTAGSSDYQRADVVLGGYSLNQVVRIVILQVTTNGPIIGIVLGALVTGSEHGWATIKTALTQGPSRLVFCLAQAIALVVAVSGLVFSFLVAGGVGSVVVTLLLGAHPAAPSYSWLLRGIGDSWSILVMWTMWGALWATLLRGAGPGIAAAYTWTLIDGFLSQVYPLSSAVAAIDKILPFSIVLAIQLSFPPPGQVDNQLPGGLAAGNAYLGPWLLLAYAVGLIVLGTIVMQRRDIA